MAQIKAQNLKVGDHILQNNMYRTIVAVYINKIDLKVVIEFKDHTQIYLDFGAIVFTM